MKRSRRLPLAAVLVATLSASGGSAEPPFAAFFPQGENACWGRTYDAAHLTRHPNQKVKAIHPSDPWDARPHIELPDGLDYVDPGGDRLAGGKATAELLVEQVDGAASATRMRPTPRRTPSRSWPATAPSSSR